MNSGKTTHVNSAITKFLFLFIVIFLFLKIDFTLAQSTFKNTFKLDKKVLFEDGISGGANIKMDHQGNFIVTEMNQNRIKYYNPSGNLLFTFGKKGRGPGDFSYPTSTIRLGSGQFLTAEFQGKLSLFNASGDSLLKIFNVKLLPLTDVYNIDDTRVLLVGRNRTKKQQNLLHIFDISEGRITKSFLNSPFVEHENSYGGIFSTFASLVTVDVNYEKIAVVIVPFSEVKIFTNEGNLVKSFKLNLEYFNKIEKVNEDRLSPRRFNQYMTTFSMFNGIYLLKNNDLYLSYYKLTEFERQKGAVSVYSLAKVRSDGRVQIEVNNTPNLRAVYRDNLYFDNLDMNIKADLLKGRFME